MLQNTKVTAFAVSELLREHQQGVKLPHLPPTQIRVNGKLHFLCSASKTPALTENKNMGIWAVSTLNQPFIRGFYTETKLSKKQMSKWQNTVLCDRSILYSAFYLSY